MKSTLMHGAAPQRVQRERHSSAYYKLAIAALAIMYGAFLAGLPVDVFKDRHNYMNYVTNAAIILENRASAGPVAVLANEPLWLLMNSAVGSILEPEQAIRFFIFLSATIFAFLFLSQSPANFLWLLALLFFPQIVKNYIVHLRQGVAISVFFLGWSLVGEKRRWTVMMLAPFIHASFFFVLGLLFISKVLSVLRLSYGIRTVVYVAISVFVAIFAGYLVSLVGARQAAVYGFSTGDVSGFGFMFWAAILALFVYQGRDFLRIFSFESSVIVFYLCAYFFIEVSARIFESALFLVLLAGLQMKKEAKLVFVLAIFGSGAFSYLMRLGQPWLGFGHGLF